MPRDLRSPVWVCSFHEVGLSREIWIVQGQAKKCMKKDLMKLGFVSYTRSYFLLLSGCQRMRHFAPNRMRGVTLKHTMTLYGHYIRVKTL
jgi:hypothetical protein